MSREQKPRYDGVTYNKGNNWNIPQDAQPSPKKIKSKSGKSKKKKVLIVLASCMLLAVLIFCFFPTQSYKTSPTIADYSRTQLKALTTAAINQAVLECVTESLTYGDLVEIHKDSLGKITLIESNWSYLNLIARQTATVIEEKLNQAADKKIKIPLGNLTGWPLLTGLGPEIEITISPQESVECNFVSEFTSAGINQTLHKIYLVVVTSVDLVMPTYETTIINSAEILVTEGVIIGDVPEIYLQNAG